MGVGGASKTTLPSRISISGGPIQQIQVAPLHSVTLDLAWVQSQVLRHLPPQVVSHRFWKSDSVTTAPHPQICFSLSFPILPHSQLPVPEISSMHFPSCPTSEQAGNAGNVLLTKRTQIHPLSIPRFLSGPNQQPPPGSPPVSFGHSSCWVFLRHKWTRSLTLF